MLQIRAFHTPYQMLAAPKGSVYICHANSPPLPNAYLRRFMVSLNRSSWTLAFAILVATSLLSVPAG